MSVPAGWYDDGSGRQRWWDGNQWSDAFSDSVPTAVLQEGSPQPPAEPSTSNSTSQTPQKKPWFKRWWVWVIIAVVILALGSALSGNDEVEEPVAVEETQLIEEEVAPANLVEVPDVQGMPGDEANDLLEEAGLTATFEFDSGKSVIMKGNWDVVSTDPTPGTEVEAGSSVLVLVTDAMERVKAENEQSRAEHAAAPIDAVEAQTFCDNYASLNYPYGAKLHWVLGKLAEEPRDGGGWYLKVEATITNEYNAERKMNIECHVSGTNGSPTMDEFLAY